MMTVRLPVVLFLLLATQTAVWGQRYSFKHYAEEQGLGDLVVQALLQDRTGYLWVGTQNALYRYDGRSFRGFGRTEGLPNPLIRFVHQGPDGELWVGTFSGLARLAGTRFEQIDLGVPYEIKGFGGIASGPDGTLYVATTKGLAIGNRFPGRTGREFHFLPKPAAASGNAVFSVHVDPQGVVWFGYGLELCRKMGESVTVVSLKEGVPPDQWQGIASDPKGNLWLRSMRRLLMREKESGRFVDMSHGLPPARSFASVTTTAEGEVLVPTTRGLALWTGRAWQMICSAQRLLADSINVAYQDREGSIWMGYQGVGLSSWLGRAQWGGWAPGQRLSRDGVCAEKPERHGRLWGGSRGGL